MKYILTIFFLCIITHRGNSQIALSTTTFLKNAQHTPSLVHHQQKMDFLRTRTYEIPVVDKLEFRTQTEKYVLEQQEYLVRLSLTGRKERRAYRQLHQTSIFHETTRRQAVLQDELLYRYKLLVTWWDFAASLPLLQQHRLIIEDRIFVLKKQALVSDFNIEHLVDTENDLHKIQQTILEYQLRQKQLENTIQRTLNMANDLSVDTTNWLSFSDLKKQVQQLNTVKSYHPNLVQQQSEIALIKTEEQLENARNRKWLDFVEARYQRDPKDRLFEEFTLGLGIEIPFKNRALIKLNELALEHLEAQNALTLENIQLANETLEIREALELLFKQHDMMTQQMQSSQAQFSLTQFKNIPNADPLALLKIQEGLLKRQISLHEIEVKAFHLYIDLLDLTGEVVKFPLRNYLHKKFEGL